MKNEDPKALINPDVYCIRDEVYDVTGETVTPSLFHTENTHSYTLLDSQLQINVNTGTPECFSSVPLFIYLFIAE